MPKEKTEVSDSSVITPGTVFMEKLSKALEYYIRLRLNSDHAWINLKVILSDSNVPGEGEHKIMSFIRAQRNTKGYNPNLRHCLYGLDADLIMLALATHEAHFFILRETYQDVSVNNQSTILSKFKQGLSANIQETIKSREWYKRILEESKNVSEVKKPYEFLDICILREYIHIDMSIEGYQVETDRVVDDFVFICFFMGNDFLPNVPSLVAHERALDLLIEVYKRTLKKTEGYLIDTGKMTDRKHAYIKISRVEKFLADLATYEDKIFMKRYHFREKMFRKFSQGLSGDVDVTCSNDWGNATNCFVEDNCVSPSGSTANYELDIINNTAQLMRLVNDNLKEQQDTYKSNKFNDKIHFGLPGWKTRFYKERFCAENSTQIESMRKVLVEKYIEGLCWVLQYYFVGVCSWSWYYPYLYAPCSSDLKNLSCGKVNFKIGQPLKPFDQLMAVLPPQSSAELPRLYAELMNCKDSAISNFYPKGDIEIDMDGKRFHWQGIIKLPFIEEELLLASTKPLESKLEIHEVERNSVSNDKIFLRNDTDIGFKIASTSEYSKVPVDFESCEISGALCTRKGLKDGGFFSKTAHSMDYIEDDIVVSAEFLSQVVVSPISRLLENVEVPEKTITANDVQKRELWHEHSIFSQSTNRNHGYSQKFDYRNNTASSGHRHETWRCAGSGWVGSTGRGSTGGGQGRASVQCHESHRQGEHTFAYTGTSGLYAGNRGQVGISPVGNNALVTETRRPQGTTVSDDGWQTVGPRRGIAGRGRCRT